MGREPEYKDILGLPIHVGDLVEFINNEPFKVNACHQYFLEKQWKIKRFSHDDVYDIDILYVYNGHLPGSSYEYYFPLGCVRLVCDYDDIILSDIYDVSSLFNE